MILRLYDAQLPVEIAKLRHLAEQYFQHIHPLRCLAFIHPPTFLQALDQRKCNEIYGAATAYIVFALGAR